MLITFMMLIAFMMFACFMMLATFTFMVLTCFMMLAALMLIIIMVLTTMSIFVLATGVWVFGFCLLLLCWLSGSCLGSGGGTLCHSAHAKTY